MMRRWLVLVLVLVLVRRAEGAATLAPRCSVH
ncbi:hypothetical protein FHU37_002095 [Allostreptomyces psammosilenae]|uniref:Uncharacterized protein n=1 Tax=Allostreptomyces psammosilenae TaxID=1892865 RepID=A0A853A3R8_9ACTN|nr:hypothetical protein [Allostreptomyces psammosilenae]